MSHSDQIELSAVVPVYGCANCLSTLTKRLAKSLEQITDDWEVIYVDDSSPDGSWDILVELAAAEPRVRAYHLSRNFGQHAAITAGLAESRGRWTVVLDCDVQDPPEEIPRLYQKAAEGFDVVLTTRDRRAQTRFRRWAGRAYFKLRNLFFATGMNTEYSTLSLLSRQVVNSFLSIRDRDRQYMLILHWLGFAQSVVEIEHGERLAGRSSYGLGQLVRVALDGMFFQTTVLLRWIVYLGFVVAAGGGLLAAYILFSYFAIDPLPGWTSLVMLILVLAGFIIISTGISALYVGKIFEQVKGRPLYVVDRAVGASADVPRAPIRDEVPLT